MTLQRSNAQGQAEKPFRIVGGDEIALTPPMGWNSWNAYHGTVKGENVIHAARAMAASGLINHGWTYINIDDAWQGQRGGKFNGIQSNAKFPDMPAMCDEIHALGLKVGIYSTPWETSYVGYIGGSSDDAGGRGRRSEYAGQGFLCPERRQPMGRLGHRLPEIRLEPEEYQAGGGNP